MFQKAAIAILFVGSALTACTTLPVDPPSCLESGCGVHGRCEPTTATCICDPGHTGLTCGECAAGFQDENHDGSCLPLCGGRVCPAHSRCSEESGRAMCSCVTGYTALEGRCAFNGGPSDSSFEGTPPDSWTLIGNVSIVPRATAPPLEHGPRGYVRFAGSGEVVQSFEMPAYTDAEPLAVRLDGACYAGSQCRNLDTFSGLALTFDDHPFELDTVFTDGPFETPRFCLGDRAFGRRLKLGIRGYGSSGETTDRKLDAFVDRISFAPMPSCAAPGTVRFTSGSAKLITNCTTGERGSVMTSISIPEALSQPALVFSMTGTQGSTAALELGANRIAEVRATGQAQTAVVCLPRWSRGFAYTLRIATEPPSRCAFGVPEQSNLAASDFAIASDPSCGEAIVDGGFEQDSLTPWRVTRATVVRAPGDAHGGSSYLQLHAPCPALGGPSTDSMIITEALTAPDRAPDLAGGPAVRFWYRSSSGEAQAGIGIGQRLAPTMTWTESVLCLGASAWGRRARLFFSALPRWQNASDVCNPGVLDIDDVAIGIDPSCPAD